jgi:DinB superfamily
MPVVISKLDRVVIVHDQSVGHTDRTMEPIGRAQGDQATPSLLGDVDRFAGDDPVAALSDQLVTAVELWRGISEEASLCRDALGKWSVRQVLNHLNDTERVLLGRAVWFARGVASPLPSLEQGPCVAALDADAVDWRDHVEEFEAVRRATLEFFRNLPRAGWMRRGVVCGNVFSARAVAVSLTGHVEHHAVIVRERFSSLQGRVVDVG